MWVVVPYRLEDKVLKEKEGDRQVNGAQWNEKSCF